MVHSKIMFPMITTKGISDDNFFQKLAKTSKYVEPYSFGLSLLRNDQNIRFGDNGWLNKDLHLVDNDITLLTKHIIQIFKFKFENLIILAIPVVPPGEKGSRRELLHHYKVIGYYFRSNDYSNMKMTEEEASIYSSLCRSLIYDQYLMTGMTDRQYYQYVTDKRKTLIDLDNEIFILHCPMIREFKFFAKAQTYKLNWFDTYSDMELFSRVYQLMDFNYQSMAPSIYLNDDTSIITCGPINNFSMSDYNKDVEVDYFYSEIPDMIRGADKNIYDINFRERPDLLRSFIEEKFKDINYKLASKDSKLIKSISYRHDEYYIIKKLLIDITIMFQLDHKNVTDKNDINNDIIDIHNSVIAWNFNLMMPIYFYYGENLIPHIQDAQQYLDSLAGPFVFELSDEFKHQLKMANKMHHITVSDSKLVKLYISIAQIYFMLMLLSNYKNSIKIENFLFVDCNEYTTAASEDKLKSNLKKIFNSTISKSTIMENIYIMDSTVVYDPIINKIIANTKSTTLDNNNKLNISDFILIIHNMKVYNVKFRKLLNNILQGYELDDYLKEDNG